ncbi:MAG: putative porin [Opitutaceae bacterium]|nr:putative porin [Opitutaceae bacterium]
MYATSPASRGRFPVARLSGFILAASLAPLGARAQDAAKKPSPLAITGDIRLRYEEDWDSQNAAGAERTDRSRGRLRARANLAYTFDQEWTAGLRIRTGNTHSQQSPHLTFASDDGVRDDLEFVLDRYFVQYKADDLTAWAGRNSWPFWQQNEFLWDDDVTPTGLAGTHVASAGKGKLTSVLGAFALPDGGYGLNGALYGAQLRYSAPVDQGQFTIAAALHKLDGSPGAEDLRNRNGERDYLLGVLGAQWSAPVGGRTLALGIDVFNNFEDYTAADAAPLPADHADETFGYVLSAQYGQLKNPRDWQLGYYYAHIETFAVNASFAQDDWVRWGSATQTDGTDGAGHEVRASYMVTKTINVVARLFIVDAITSVQDGKRFRLDLNWRF